MLCMVLLSEHQWLSGGKGSCVFLAFGVDLDFSQLDGGVKELFRPAATSWHGCKVLGQWGFGGGASLPSLPIVTVWAGQLAKVRIQLFEDCHEA